MKNSTKDADKVCPGNELSLMTYIHNQLYYHAKLQVKYRYR
jgi:hypothetical protein